jgi:hypothetical protein
MVKQTPVEPEPKTDGDKTEQSRTASQRERQIATGVEERRPNTQKKPGDRQESRHIFQERGPEDYSGNDVTDADKIVHGVATGESLPQSRPGREKGVKIDRTLSGKSPAESSSKPRNEDSGSTTFRGRMPP